MPWNSGRRARWRALGRLDAGPDESRRNDAVNSVARRYAGCNVPRYTSYPTAADFTPLTGMREHAAWLGRLDPRESISFYLHVPYCREICLYCGCNTKKAIRDDVIGAYRRALEAEIELVAGLVGEKPGIARLHWGGGTPSILGPDGLRSVATALGRRFSFDQGFEHAIELDPRYVTAELADGLVDIGINRASLGVQDVNPLVQAAIGRLQPLAVIDAAVNRLRAAGIESLNFDLMYGLPLQTVEFDPEDLRPGRGDGAGAYRLLRLCPSAAAEGQPATNRRSKASIAGSAHRSGRDHCRGAGAFGLCPDRHRSFCAAG